MTGPDRVAVVGGGMLGMVLALRLRQQGRSVVLLERAPRLGGLAAARSIGGYTWDRFYHVIAPSDQTLLDLLDEIGLGDRVRWGTTRTGFYTDGVLHSLSTTLEFLRFPPLSPIDKARLGGTILYASRIRDGRRLESVGVVEWLTRWSGRNTVDKIWLPLLKAKLGENYRLASAAFIWAIVARMYAARRSGLKREQFGYVDGGYALVLERLARTLESAGVEVRTGVRVTRVETTPEGAVVRTEAGDDVEAERVVLTVPATRVGELCPELTSAERDRLGRVTYQGIACASLLLERPLADFYVTNITDPAIPFTAVIEMTALVDRERFGGASLVYLPRYLTQDDDFWRRSDDEIEAEFLAALERMYPAFRREQVIAFQVSRVREVLAVATRDYTETTLPAVETSLPSVFLVSSAQIANGTLNVNETISLAMEQAERLGTRWGAPRARATMAVTG
ncbi:MAG: NAD(P)/FAD-dependent oxidoreductase [Gemmatimonadales bacterium]